MVRPELKAPGGKVRNRKIVKAEREAILDDSYALCAHYVGKVVGTVQVLLYLETA